MTEQIRKVFEVNQVQIIGLLEDIKLNQDVHLIELQAINTKLNNIHNRQLDIRNDLRGNVVGYNGALPQTLTLEKELHRRKTTFSVFGGAAAFDYSLEYSLNGVVWTVSQAGLAPTGYILITEEVIAKWVRMVLTVPGAPVPSVESWIGASP